ncbi:MAG: hypothetical protein WD070_04230 [Pirellulaceae bacterium]
MSKALSVNSNHARPHIIRLHGPWMYEPLALTQWGPSGASMDLPGELPPAGTMKVPADWNATLGPGFRGRVLYTRRFGRPTNLDSHERVDLVLHKIQGLAIVTLNARRLGELKIGDPPRRFDLTNLLHARNELHIEVNLPRGVDDIDAGGIVGEVHLEIREVRS